MNTSSQLKLIYYLFFTSQMFECMNEQRQKNTHPFLSTAVLFDVDAIAEELAAETAGLTRGQISVSIPAIH